MGVPVTDPVKFKEEMVVADKVDGPVTLRLPEITSFPDAFELVIVVAANVELPLTFSVPGVVIVENVFTLLLNCDNCVG